VLFNITRSDLVKALLLSNPALSTIRPVTESTVLKMTQIIEARYDIGPALKELLGRLFPGQLWQISVSVTMLM
jgi:hypothetical protein